MFANTKKRARRRGWPIIGYVGPNGSGKSVAAVWDCIPSLEQGRPVLSTVRLLDYRNPRECEGCEDPHHTRPIYDRPESPETLPVGYKSILEWREEHQQIVGYETHRQAHPLWVPFTDWQQLLDAKSMDVIMDEVAGVASSRESHAMPAPVANTLQQMRRADVTIRWTAPAWPRADKIIRECSQAVVYCTGYLPKRVEQGGEAGERVWRSRRFYKWKVYDANDFEDFTVGKREQLPSLLSDWHWGPGSGIYDAYDTFDAVLSIGTVTETGTCYRCAGTRRRHECSCSDYVESRPARGRASSPARRASAEDATPTPPGRGRRIRQDPGPIEDPGQAA